MSNREVDGGVHDNGAAFFHAGQRCFDDEEERMEVHLEGLHPVFGGEGGDVGVGVLETVIEGTGSPGMMSDMRRECVRMWKEGRTGRRLCRRALLCAS